jgi:hypothetical protein
MLDVRVSRLDRKPPKSGNIGDEITLAPELASTLIEPEAANGSLSRAAFDVVVDNLLRDFPSEFYGELLAVDVLDDPASEFGMGDAVSDREPTFVWK